MQVKHVKSSHWASIAVAAIATLGIHASAQAAAYYVHTNGLPTTGLSPSFDKSTYPYMYLEGETSDQSASGPDTFVNSADASKTFFRTSAADGNGNAITISSTGVYDGARYTSYGSDAGSYSNINSYWQDETTNLPSGSYDVFVRTYPSLNGSQTFTLYTGSDLASVNSPTATAAGTATASTAAAGWYKLGTIDLTSATDTFRLRTDTSTSTIRYDTLFFAATSVPEPASLALIGLGAGILMRRRRCAGHNAAQNI